MKYIRRSSILFFTAFLALNTAMAADLPRLRLQRWATATHIYWVRALAPDRIAVSYFNLNAGPGLDVLDSSGTIVRRVALPAGSHCVAVYPDGGLFVLDNSWGGGTDAPATVRPDGSVVTTDYPTSLVLFDPAAPNGRDFAWGVLDPTFVSWVGGLEAQPDGKVLLWGDLRLADGSFSTLIRLNLDETLDQSFHPAIMGWPRNLRTTPDGAILVETINEVLSSERREWMRLNSDGTPRSSFGITVPEGTSLSQPAVMLDDGSVILSLDGGDRLQHLFADGSSSTHDGIGFWSSFWEVSNLVPLSGGQLVIRQRPACQGGGCWAQDWLRILPGEGSGGQMFTWVPPAPSYAGPPMLFVKSLQPEAEYVVEATTDFHDWQPVFGLQLQNFERSSDRRSLFGRDFEALDLNLSARFYRTRKLD